MNKFLIVQILSCAFLTTASAQKVSETWEHEIEVIPETEKFDGVVHNAYSTFVYEATEDAVRKMILDEIKASTKDKVTKKKMIGSGNGHSTHWERSCWDQSNYKFYHGT